MTKKFLSVVALFFILLLSACTNNDEPKYGDLTLEWDSSLDLTSTKIMMPQDICTYSFKAENIKSITWENAPEGWTVSLSEEKNSITVKAPAESTVSGVTYTITIVIEGLNGEIRKQDLLFLLINPKAIAYDDPKGVFVLNEGNMTTENGSLTYITPDGLVIDDAYKVVNGTELGNVCQDMAFCDGKIYIISQNGDENAVGTKFDNDGMLVVLDAKTLKKEKAFSKSELSGLDWPTHIAVLDESHIYIRDNKGICRFDLNTKELKFIEGSEGAPKSKFVVMDGKVYFGIVKSYMGSLYEISKDSDEVIKISLPYIVEIDINEILGIQPAGDGNVWIMSFGFGEYALGKFNLSTKKIIQRQISVEVNPGASGVAFVAKGNDIYYASGTAIYTLKFDENPELDAESGLEAEKVLCDLNSLDSNAKELYNGLGINPATGMLYVNTIKGVGPFYTTNSIWEFDTTGDWTVQKNKYDNYTNFPAGFFFAGNN